VIARVIQIIILILFQFDGLGQFAFEKVELGMESSTSDNEGLAIGDYNNDGLVDIYVSSTNGKNKLFKNNGDGIFENVAERLSLDIDEASSASTWGDLNNDGYLDLYVSTVQSTDYIFLNNADGTFSNITSATEIVNNGLTKSVNMADVNNDGLLDIYVSNFYSENKLFINKGDLVFEESIVASGAMDDGPSMGSIFFDYDQDGDADLYLVHDELVTNILYQNNGDGTFTDVSIESGLNVRGYGMGVDIADFNNDGWTDIYVFSICRYLQILKMLEWVGVSTPWIMIMTDW